MHIVEDEREEMIAWFEERGIEATHATGEGQGEELVIEEADDWKPDDETDPEAV